MFPFPKCCCFADCLFQCGTFKSTSIKPSCQQDITVESCFCFPASNTKLKDFSNFCLWVYVPFPLTIMDQLGKEKIWGNGKVTVWPGKKSSWNWVTSSGKGLGLWLELTDQTLIEIYGPVPVPSVLAVISLEESQTWFFQGPESLDIALNWMFFFLRVDNQEEGLLVDIDCHSGSITSPLGYLWQQRWTLEELPSTVSFQSKSNWNHCS